MAPKLTTQTLTALICTAIVGCQSVPPPIGQSGGEVRDSSKGLFTRQTNRQQINLTISAAASLQNALSEIEPRFEQRYPEIDIFYNWGGSGTLQRQIEQGAPADIFFSASPAQMSALAQKGKLQAHSSKVILTNQLVLIAPTDSPLTSFADLSRLKASEHVAVGEFRSVPAGQYAQETLNHFQLLPKLSSQLIFFNNVRGVLAAVESGHAAAGLVYRTEAQLSNQVKVVAIAPNSSHSPIHYPVAVLQRSEHPQAAQQYIDFLSEPAAIDIFKRYGFNPH